jgi:hypothetical protein
MGRKFYSFYTSITAFGRALIFIPIKSSVAILPKKKISNDNHPCPSPHFESSHTRSVWKPEGRYDLNFRSKSTPLHSNSKNALAGDD